MAEQALARRGLADSFGPLKDLVGWVEAALQIGLVRPRTGRTGIAIALYRLDAAEREHEPSGGDDEVRTGAIGPCNLGGVISSPGA